MEYKIKHVKIMRNIYLLKKVGGERRQDCDVSLNDSVACWISRHSVFVQLAFCASYQMEGSHTFDIRNWSGQTRFFDHLNDVHVKHWYHEASIKIAIEYS